MINYSIALRGNPIKPEEPKKAYAVAQCTSVLPLDKFAGHISSHGCVYQRADIMAILLMAVDCMKEQLLAGNKVELGDLGSFYVSLSSEGADTAADFRPDVHIRRVRVIWECGSAFANLLDEAEFNLVSSRKVQAKVLKAVKSGETTVDLTEESTDTDSGSTDDSGSDSGDNPLV